MPSPLDRIKLTKSLDRRIHLTDEQRADIRARYKRGEAIRAIARDYAGICSRSLIQLLVNPDRAKQVQERGRQHWREYHDAERHTKAIRELRRYKKQLVTEKRVTLPAHPVLQEAQLRRTTSRLPS